MSAPYAVEKKPTLMGLHLVRGLCAIAVMLYHYLHEAGVGTFHAAGTYGVYIFFVLSGYALTYVYEGEKLGGRKLYEFFEARVYRIVPLYFLVATYQLYMLRNAPAIWEKYLLNITMMFGLATPGATSIVPGGWSIGIEAVFYLLFPVLLAIRPIPVLLAVLFAAVIVNQMAAGASYKDPAMSANQWAFYTQAPTFLVYFIGGILLARLRPQLLAWTDRRPASLSVAAPVLLLLLIALFAIPAVSGISRESLLAGPISFLMIGGCFAVIAVGSITLIPSGPLSRAAAYLGDISYSLYLLHYPIWHRVQLHLEASLVVQGMVSIVLTLLLATASYHLFEKPIARMRKRPHPLS